MLRSESIQIFKENFNFYAAVDIPGIGVVITAFTTNILAWSSETAVHPILTYIMTGLAVIYFILKIGNVMLTRKSIKLDNELKRKKLES